jgi:hypothetical protein
MSDWGTPVGSNRYLSTGSNGSGSQGSANCTASGTANVKGAWSQCFSSVPFDVSGFAFMLEYIYNANAISVVLFDIGVGASGSEIVVVPNLQVGSTYQSGPIRASDRTPFIPFSIPAGSRIAMRAQSSYPSDFLQGSLMVQARTASTPPGFHRCTDYGVGTDRGVQTNAAAADTKGSWTEVTASTTARHRALLLNAICFSGGSNDFHVDIGIGASGSEVVLVPDIQITHGGGISSIYARNHWPELFYVDLPAGTRLAVRQAAQIVGSHNDDLHCIIHGLD